MAIQKSTFISNTDAVSEVIGEIMLTAIAVIMFSVVAVFIFSYADPQEQVHADIQGWVDVESDSVYLRHAGGERVDIAMTRVLLDINDTRRELSSDELEAIKGSDTWDLGETIVINSFELWSESISEDDNIALIMLTTDSNFVIKSGTLLGADQETGPYSGGGGSGNGTSPIAPVLSGQNPLNPYESNTSQSVTFTATSSQSSINEFLLDGNHLAWSNGTNPSYTNTSALNGTYTVALIARNTTDTLLTDSLTWTWNVISEATIPVNASGTNMVLQKTYKGGSIADGDYIKFRTGGGGSSITIDGVTTGISNNRNVMLVMNGEQTSGTAYIGTSGSSRQITTYDFNVAFYMNSVLVNTGSVTSIYIRKADNLESTLSYHLPSDLSQAYFSSDGTVIIDWSPDNDSEINLYNVIPASGVNFGLEFDPTRTYIAGFDANYTIA